jgi:hypothetical protein
MTEPLDDKLLALLKNFRTEGNDRLFVATLREIIRDEIAAAKKPKRQKAPMLAQILFPPWWPQKAWEGFVAMRQRIRAPLTERAIDLCVKELTDFRAQGHDPGTVLDRSTQNSWKGLFPLKGGESLATGNVVPIRSTSLSGWVGRLEAFEFGDPEAGLPKHHWPAEWGKRDEVPAEAIQAFKTKHAGNRAFG